MIGYSQAFNGLYGPKPIEEKNKMNQRIQELALQAGAVFEKTNGLNDCPQDSLVGDEIEKFAELIVKECANTIEKFAPGQMDKEGEEWTNGYDDGLKTGASLIREHFGVES